MLGFGIPQLTPVVPRTKKSKWDKTNMKTVMPNVACILPPDLSPEVLHTYLLRFQFEEVEYKMSHLEEEMSNVNYGENLLTNFTASDIKLQLTPDVRARDNLVSERRQIVDSIEKIFPAFRAPLSILLSLQKSVERIELNSPSNIGQILGPSAMTLKNLEKDYNVRISIRGPKSPVIDGVPQDEDDNGHVLIIGDNDEEVKSCRKRIESIINVEAVTLSGSVSNKNEMLSVNPDDYSLSFDPTVETVPWEELKERQEGKTNAPSDRFVSVIDDLINEINKSDKNVEEDETPERKNIIARFTVDLSKKDISCLLREAPPPGIEI